MKSKKLIIWILSGIIFSGFLWTSYTGALFYKNVSKERIYAKDGSKRPSGYRSSYYGGAYRYGK